RYATLTIIFFFIGSCAHRDLHSFPTRRSSDLAHAPAVGKRERGREPLGPGRSGRDDGGHHLARERPIPLRRHAESGGQRRKGIGDRKSTRLNSSHDQISYAVFCLKKKKTNYVQ